MPSGLGVLRFCIHSFYQLQRRSNIPQIWLRLRRAVFFVASFRALLAPGPENAEEVKQKIAKFAKEESSLKRRELF